MYLNGNMKNSTNLKKFDKDQNFYYWYRLKKKLKLFLKQKIKKEGLNYINLKFKKLKNLISNLFLILPIFIKMQKNINKRLSITL